MHMKVNGGQRFLLRLAGGFKFCFARINITTTKVSYLSTTHTYEYVGREI